MPMMGLIREGPDGRGGQARVLSHMVHGYSHAQKVVTRVSRLRARLTAFLHSPSKPDTACLPALPYLLLLTHLSTLISPTLPAYLPLPAPHLAFHPRPLARDMTCLPTCFEHPPNMSGKPCQ